LEGGNPAEITFRRLLHPPSGISINTTIKISNISITIYYKISSSPL
jgi:hypothetical protein